MAAFSRHGEEERAREDGEGDRHPRRPDEQEGLSPDAVDERHGDERRDDVDDAGDDVEGERVGRREAGDAPQRPAVIEDGVDAHELLEHGEPHADPHDGQDAA